VEEVYEIKKESTWEGKLYIVGDYSTVLNCCRRATFPKGLCVTIKPCEYVYAGGMEAGFEIGFIQYPKYKEDTSSILQKCIKLGKDICEQNFQWSFTIVSSHETFYYSRRDSLVGK
jgi:hypothetical protein